MKAGAKKKTGALRKWRNRAIIFVISIVVAPICAAFVAVYTQWGRDRMRDAAIDAIRSELGLQAEMRQVEVSMFPTPEVSARGIVLDDPVYGRFAEADGLTIEPSILALMAGRVDLSTIRIEGPVLNLVVRDGEIRNLPRIQGTSSGGGGDLPFDRLIVERARLTVDADTLGTADLNGVHIEIDTEGSAFDIDVEASSGRWEHINGTERLSRFGATGHVDPEEGIEIDDVSFRSPHLHIDATDGWIPLPFDDGYHGTAEVWIDLDHLAQLPHAFEVPPLSGELRVAGTIEGSEEGPTGEGTITLTEAIIDDRGLGDIELKVEVDPTEIRITEGQMHVIREGGVANVSGTIGLGDGFPVDVSVDVDGLRFAKLLEQLQVTPNAIVQWHMDAETHLTGTLDPLQLEGPIEVEMPFFLVTRDAWHDPAQERIVGAPRARVSGQVRLDEDALRFEQLVGDTRNTRIRCDVMLGFDNDIRVSASADIDLADASPLMEFPLGGTGRVTVDVTGTFSDPQVQGDLRIDGFSFDTFPIGNVESHFQLEEEGLAVRFPQVTAVKNDSRFTIDDLFLDFRDDRFAIQGQIDAQRLTLADFYHIFHFENDERFAGYQALTHGRIDLRYTLGYPNDSPTGTMIAAMDLQIPEADIDGFAFTDGELRGTYRWLHYEQGYRGGELALEHVHLRKGDGVLTVNGRMGLGGELQMTAAADRIAISDLEGLGDRLPDVDGVIGIVGDVRGTAETPRAEMDVTVTGLSYGQAMLGDARLYVKLTDREDPWVRVAEGWDPANLPAGEPCAAARSGFHRGRWPADPPLQTSEGPQPRLTRPMAFLVCGRGLSNQVQVDLAVGRTTVYPLRGDVTLAGLVLDPFLREVSGGEPLSGEITGTVSLTGGAMLADNSLVGRILLDQLRVGEPSVELRSDGPIDVRMDRGDFEVARAILTGPSSRVTISGGGSNRRGLALAVDGQIDLGIVAQLSPRFTHAGGRVDVRANVSGPFEAPAIFGRAVVRDGAFRYAGFGEPLTDLDGQVTFSARRMLFESFRARMAGGQIAMSGAATLRGRGIDRYEFDIDARDLSLTPDTGVEVALGGGARLAWTRAQRLPLLTGTVRLQRVAYTKPIAVSQTLGELSRRRRAEVDQYDPEEDRVELDLRVVDEAPMLVANNLIDAEVRIEDSERPFRIVGTDQRFGVLGTLVIPRGVVQFRNSEFDVRRGVIDFDDTHRVDPNFDVSAVTEIRRSGDLTGPSWRVTLHAHGNRDSFALDTFSEPALSQEDIALLLTVGMTRAEFDQLQAGDVGSTIALEALAAVTGIDREVQRAVPVIDDFQITSRYSTQTNRTEPQLTIGKRIAERVRLTASTGLGESREIRTSVEWRLNEETSVQAVYDNVDTTAGSSLGNLGVDVRWRLEFE